MYWDNWQSIETNLNPYFIPFSIHLCMFEILLKKKSALLNAYTKISYSVGKLQAISPSFVNCSPC